MRLHSYRPRALGLPGLLATLALVAVPAEAPAQLGTRYIEVYGSDRCPPGGANEIVVCARKKESDRYRIPQMLRSSGADQTGPGQSWASRAQSFEYVGRTGIQSCSATGGGGSTGCEIEMIRKAKLERQQAAAETAAIP